MGLKEILRKRKKGTKEAVLRRSLFLLALVAALAASSVVAQAQVCRLLVASAPTVRATGITETVGDIVVQCRPDPSGFAPPTPTAITLTLNTNITSQIDETTIGGTDHPLGGQTVLTLEEDLITINPQADGGGTDIVDASEDDWFGDGVTADVAHAVLSEDGNSVTWTASTATQRNLLNLGSSGAGFQLTVVGLRANAARLGDGEDINVSVMVAGLASASGTVKAASVKTAFGVKVTKAKDRECDAKTGEGAIEATIMIEESEGFNAAFVADTIDELELAFSNIPEGVTVKFDTSQDDGVVKSGRREEVDSDGVLALSSSGAGEATFEIATSTITATRDDISVKVMFEWEAGTPELGEGMVMVSFNPTSDNMGESDDNNLRYAASGVSNGVVEVQSCDVTLTFPFVTNQLGYDTGIAIANTTENSGSCAVKYYGSNAPASDSQMNVGGQAVMAFLVSGEAPSFQGYLKVACTFSAEGFAFLTDGFGTGSSPNLAMGYRVP